MNKSIIKVIIASIFLICFTTAFAAKKPVVKPHKILAPKVLNLINGKVISPLIVQDCDSRMHMGTITVFMDKTLVGVGGKKVGGTIYAPITKVTLSPILKGHHTLIVTDGIARTSTYPTK